MNNGSKIPKMIESIMITMEFCSSLVQRRSRPGFPWLISISSAGGALSPAKRHGFGYNEKYGDAKDRKIAPVWPTSVGWDLQPYLTDHQEGKSGCGYVQVPSDYSPFEVEAEMPMISAHIAVSGQWSFQLYLASHRYKRRGSCCGNCGVSYHHYKP